MRTFASTHDARRLFGALLLAALVAGGCGKSAHVEDPHVLNEDIDPAEVPAMLAEAQIELAATPDEPYWPYRMGQLHLFTGDASRAESALRQALFVDPYYAPALALLSKLYFDQGRHEDAIGYLEVARSAPEEFPAGFPEELSAGLAVHYDAIGEVQVAEDLVNGIARAREEPRIASAVTYVKLRGEALANAREVAERALEADPENAVNLNNFGITRLQAGDPHGARDAFLRANALDDALPGPYYNLAIVEHFYFFDEGAAREWFARYWELSRDDPDELADVFLAEGGE